MYKSKLQEICQKQSWNRPEYSHTMEGKIHSARFSASVIINGNTFHTDDSYASIKQAQNEVARIACDHFSDPQPSLLTTIQKGGSVEVPRNEGINLFEDETVSAVQQVGSHVTIDDHNPIAHSVAPHAYKGLLQSFVQKKNIAPPVYSCEREGPPHDCSFKSQVTVDGKVFKSPRFFRTLKEAEQAAAKVALLSLDTDKVQEVDISAYKNLLLSLVRKEGFGVPLYDTSMHGASHSPSFISTVIIDGKTFQGDSGKSKKLAEMSAAKVAYTDLSERKNHTACAELNEKSILNESVHNFDTDELSKGIIKGEGLGEGREWQEVKSNNVGAEYKKVYVFRRTPNLVLPVHVNLNNILPITDDTWVAVGEY